MTDILNANSESSYEGLNKYLNGIASPINPDTQGLSPIQFDGLYERDTISNRFVKNLSFDKISGGTCVLGGTQNGNGLLQIKNGSGTTIVQGDNVGNHYYTTTGQEQISVDANGFHAYDAAGSETYRIGTAGIYGFGTSETVLNLRDTPSATTSYLSLGYNINPTYGTVGYLTAGGNYGLMMFTSKKEVFSGNVISLLNNGTNGTVEVFANNDLVLTSDRNVNIVSDFDDSGSGTMYFTNNKTNVYRFYSPGDSGYYTLTMDANKSAIMPTSQGYRALYCIESPEVWFMDFVKDKKSLDPLFLEVTEPPYRFIKCEEGDYQVWGKRKAKSSIRFEEMTEEQFKQNDNFWSSAYKIKKPVEKVLEGFRDVKKKDKNGNITITREPIYTFKDK